MCDITSMDRIKYRRMLPLYQVEVYVLKRTKQLCGRHSLMVFAVHTNKIPLTGVGMDHRDEQVNKSLKIDGDIVENAHTR